MCKEWIFSNTFSRKPRETDVKSKLYRLYEEYSKVKKTLYGLCIVYFIITIKNLVGLEDIEVGQVHFV